MGNLVTYRDEKSGQDLKLDLSDGRVFDLAGHQIAHWTPADDDNTALLADYAADHANQILCATLGEVDPARAREARSSFLALLGAGGEDGQLVRMDLGPGDVHIPSALPNYAAGYKNEQPIGDMLSPPIMVPKTADYYYTFAKEDAFQRARPMSGGPGDVVPEIGARLSNAQFSTKERALGGFVGTQTSAAADAPLRIQQATVRRVVNALLLEREIRVASLVTTAANWDPTVVATLGAGFQWNGGASADPVKDLHTRIESSWGGVTGIAMSERVWDDFVRNPAVKSYYAFSGSAAPIPNESQISALLKLPPVYVGKMKVINTAGVLEYIWGNDVVLFRQPEQMPPVDQEDVATSYTFRWAGGDARDGVYSGGFLIRQFFVQDRGSRGGMKIVCVHNDDEKMTSPFVGGLIKAAHQ